jgi:hypothetical protein
MHGWGHGGRAAKRRALALCWVPLAAFSSAQDSASPTHPHVITILAPHHPHKEHYDEPGSWHAQKGQDRTIAKLFANKRAGFFIDLAANHAVDNSNTRALERDFGWGGLCIDANVDLLWELANERSCRVIGAVVTSSSNATVAFKLSDIDDAYSAIGTPDKARGGASRRQREFRTSQLADVLSFGRVPATVDYLSLDVEGAEEDILLHYPLSRGVVFSAMTVERPSKPLRKHLQASGYYYLRDHGCFGDQLWVHGSLVATAEARLGLVPWDVDRAKSLGCQLRQRGVHRGEAPPQPGAGMSEEVKERRAAALNRSQG